jgi:hypothetical protein
MSGSREPLLRRIAGIDVGILTELQVKMMKSLALHRPLPSKSAATGRTGTAGAVMSRLDVELEYLR